VKGDGIIETLEELGLKLDEEKKQRIRAIVEEPLPDTVNREYHKRNYTRRRNKDDRMASVDKGHEGS
jgi:hypothetical protein